MPQGVEVTVEDDVATVVFANSEARGEGLNALLKAAGNSSAVEKVTLPEEAYIVHVEVAKAAGLLASSAAPVKKAAPKSPASKADVPEA